MLSSALDGVEPPGMYASFLSLAAQQYSDDSIITVGAFFSSPSESRIYVLDVQLTVGYSESETVTAVSQVFETDPATPLMNAVQQSSKLAGSACKIG